MSQVGPFVGFKSIRQSAAFISDKYFTFASELRYCCAEIPENSEEFGSRCKLCYSSAHLWQGWCFGVRDVASTLSLLLVSGIAAVSLFLAAEL